MKSVSRVRREIFLGWLGFFGTALYVATLLALWAIVVRSAWQADWPQMSAFMLVLLFLQRGRK